MTGFRSLAILSTDFPDDQIWSEDGETVIRMGGQAIAMVVAGMLRGIGGDVDEPYEEPDHGWRIEALMGGRSLLFQITDLREEVYLHCEDTSWLNKVLNRHNPAFVEVVNRLNDILSADGRFHDVLWFPLDNPVSGNPGSRNPDGSD